MLPFLNIFGLALPVAPFTYLIGIWFGLSLVEKYAHRHKLNSEILYNLAFISLIAGVIGARLAYVARFPNAFIADPISLVSINLGLFDPAGGIVIGLIAALIYGQRKKLPFWPTLDAITPLFAVFMLAVPIANLASGFAYGAESNLPWAFELWGATRHPAQIYEMLGAGLILWFFWPSRILKKFNAGTIFMQFIAVSAIARLFFEVFRGDSLITVYNLRWAQIIAWLIIAAAFWGHQQLNQEKVKQE